MSPMKVIVPGRTPMERLMNLAKRVIAVPKEEVEQQAKKWSSKSRKQKA